MENSQENLENLNKNIAELSEIVKKMNSYKFVLLRGIVTGVGTFIGATIIAAIAIAIVVQILGFLGIEGYFESFLPKNR
jgi:hypothetical protein